MTNHIPPEKLLPQDMVDLYDHGPADEPHETPVVQRVHASDAKHAIEVEPGRYALEPKGSRKKVIGMDFGRKPAQIIEDDGA